jgi:hypothetical protein
MNSFREQSVPAGTSWLTGITTSRSRFIGLSMEFALSETAAGAGALDEQPAAANRHAATATRITRLLRPEDI